jgi:hypothetical protein
MEKGMQKAMKMSLNAKAKMNMFEILCFRRLFLHMAQHTKMFPTIVTEVIMERNVDSNPTVKLLLELRASASLLIWLEDISIL